MKNKQNNWGFKVPEGYFENFDRRFHEKIEEPGAFLPKEDGHGIPVGYFDDFNSRLNKRMGLGETKVIPLHNYKKYLFAAASVAALIALFMLIPSKENSRPSFDQLANTDIVNYMEFDELDLTDAEIAQLLPVDELELNDMFDNRLKEDQIIEYLDNSIDEYDDLNIDIDE